MYVNCMLISHFKIDLRIHFDYLYIIKFDTTIQLHIYHEKFLVATIVDLVCICVYLDAMCFIQ